MKLELNMNQNDFQVELVHREGNMHTLMINGKAVTVDVVQVEKGIYSFLYDGQSYVMEVVPGQHAKNYLVSHRCLQFEVEVIDAETRYARSRLTGNKAQAENLISSPMPGKVVRIPVETGQEVKEGDTLIIISAMKMESEYKSGKDGTVKEIFVNEGDTIEGRQKLIELE